MIRKLFFTFVVAVLFTGCTSYECAVSEGELVPGVPEYTFTNGLMKIKVVSGVSGIVSGFEYLPDKFNLFEPMKYQEKIHDLLPSQVSVTVTGGRELFWGNGNFINTPMNVHKVYALSEKAGIEMSTRFFQGENIEARKSIEIASGTLAVDIRFTMVNRNRKEQVMSLWKHLTAQLTPGQRDIIIIPARSGVDRVAGRAVLAMEYDAIYHDFEPEHQAVFIAPLAPWIARSSSDGVNRGTLVMSCDELMEKDARFYTWKHPVKKLHTAELILPPKKLASGKSTEYRLRYFYFPHLRALRALDGAAGYDVEPDALVIESAVPSKAQQLKLFCGNEFIGSYDVPALPAGKAYRIALDKKYTTKNVVIKIETGNGKNIILPKIRESVKK